MPLIDLYSDTATKPSAEMRRFMADAAVGDEQKGEDPTVNALQEEAARLLGKEAALFLPSSTMSNAIAFAVLARPGDEVILDRTAHPAHYEGGGAGAIAGVLLRPVEGERGIFTAEQVRAAVRPDDPHFPRTALVSVENTTNQGGGAVWPILVVRSVATEARRHGLRLHLDGARLMNAVVASGTPAREYAAPFDLVTLCLSKGLGAPVGSILAGDRTLLAEARRWKQRLGGAMRQAGIIAAGGLYALRHNIDRLADDHANARRLAEGLATLPGIHVDPATVETNMVFFELEDVDPGTFLPAIVAAGVRMSSGGAGRVRAVTHLDVSAADIDRAVEVVGSVMRELRGTAAHRV